VYHLIEYTLAGLALGALFWLPGFAIVRLVPSFGQLGGLVPLARVCVGLAGWIAASFTLCVLGEWHLWSAFALIGGIAVAAGWARLRPAKQPEPSVARAATDETWLRAAIVVLLIALFLRAIGPEVSWDAAAYHLTLPKLYLHAGGFRAVPMNVYSNWPLATELLFSIAMLLKDYVLAKLVHFGFGLLTLWAMALACRELHGRPNGALTASILLASPVVLFELPVAYVDLAEAFFLMAAVVFMLRAKQRDSTAKASLLLAGICCGVLVGVKLTGVAASAAVAALYVPEILGAVRAREFGPRLRNFAVYFALPVIALGIPWLLKAAWFTGNPIYPFFFDTFGGSDWSASLASRFAAWQAALGMGREPLDYLLLPLRVSLQIGESSEGFLWAIGSYWLALVPLSLAFGLKVRLVRCCLAVAGLMFLGWAVSAQNARFLVPILPLLAVAAGVTLQEMGERFLAPERLRVARRSLLPAIGLGLLWINGDLLIGGFQRLILYQAQPAELQDGAVDPAFRFINRELPEGARLLFLNTNQGFFCDRDYLADSFFQASQISDWLGSASDADDVLRRLRDREVTHVLYFDHDWGASYPAALMGLLQDSERVERIYGSADADYELYALRDRDPI
jgi:hypothetical protein